MGPRFLKPTPKTTVYIAEEALYWAENVEHYRDPIAHDELWNPGQPFTAPVGFQRPLTVRERAILERSG